MPMVAAIQARRRGLRAGAGRARWPGNLSATVTVPPVPTVVGPETPAGAAVVIFFGIDLSARLATHPMFCEAEVEC